MTSCNCIYRARVVGGSVLARNDHGAQRSLVDGAEGDGPLFSRRPPALEILKTVKVQNTS